MVAVKTCEAAKTGRKFDPSKIDQEGWKKFGSQFGPLMFSKFRNEASIAIASTETGQKSGCIIMGWVNETNVVDVTKSRVAELLELEFKNDTAGAPTANANGWNYEIRSFTKPEITNQTRLVIVIAADEAAKEL